MKIFQPKIIESMKGYRPRQLVNDLIAGLIVAIVALPLSIALAIASGAAPEQGLYTAIVAGFVIALFGGSRVNISGPTAAFATIVAGIIATDGLGGLIVSTIMAGIILILMGVLRLGALIKYIPPTITTGFTSGIAVTIVIGQIKDFMGLNFGGMTPVESIEKLEAVAHSVSTVNPWAVLVGAFGLLVLIVWPMLGKVGKRIPGSLIAVLLGSGLVLLLGQMDIFVPTIETQFGMSQKEIGLIPSLPDFRWEMVPKLLPSAFTIAILAAVESLLSCVVSDDMIRDRHDSNTELVAQGLGNIASGFFGGLPATGAIARTAANVKNGGRTPISGMVHAVVLLLVLLFLMPYAGFIPMPIIAAILFVVAYNMCEWRQFVKICRSAPPSDVLVLAVTFLLTVVFDLVVAIAVGMVLSVVLFMKRMGDVTHVNSWSDDEFLASQSNQELCDIPDRTAVLEIEGPMFFASSDKFRALTIKEDVRVVILRMREVPLLDMSGIKNLFGILKECREKNRILLISHAGEQPMKTMRHAGLVAAIGEESFLPDIETALARAAELTADGEGEASETGVLDVTKE